MLRSEVVIVYEYATSGYCVYVICQFKCSVLAQLKCASPRSLRMKDLLTRVVLQTLLILLTECNLTDEN